ncbi:unnamed protein product [Prorocentrum cordatum]|uniref:Uncharacterized protein n=1 Tax=Prorocentrum cordatum TaxID=2364126 RepID=A0ABN9YG74_9DINO|nr:unnamed protein product [Polarella glacialis]
MGAICDTSLTGQASAAIRSSAAASPPPSSSTSSPNASRGAGPVWAALFSSATSCSTPRNASLRETASATSSGRWPVGPRGPTRSWRARRRGRCSSTWASGCWAMAASAACFALQMGDDERPSESFDFALGNMLAQVAGVRGAAMRDWGVVFAAAEMGFVAETGHVDDSVALGSPSGTLAPEVAEALVRRASEGGPGSRRAQAADPAARPFDSLTLVQCERDLKAAYRALGYDELNITPCAVRHAVPSRDIHHGHRNLSVGARPDRKDDYLGP